MRRLFALGAVAYLSVMAWGEPAGAGCFARYRAAYYPSFCYSPCQPLCGSVEPVCYDVACGPCEVTREPRPDTREPRPDTREPRDVNRRGNGTRTWLYGDAPQVVIGRLHGVSDDGQVMIARQEGGVVSIPVHELSNTDRKIVVTRLASGNRRWIDRSGQHELAAEFVRVDDRTVVLKSTEGKAIHVAFDKLSLADQWIVRNLARTPIPDDVVVTSKVRLASR
jgi:hypothetical protein